MNHGEHEASAPTDSDPSQEAAQEILLRHQPCTRCSYNLYGLPIAGTCPECGHPVALSLRGDLLQHASPEYLHTLRSGLSIVLYTILAMVLLSILGVFAVVALTANFANLSLPFNASNVQFLLGMITLAMYGILFFGYLKLTEPDPGIVGVEKPGNARSLLRVIVLSQAAVKAIEVGLGFFVPAANNSGLAIAVVSGVIGLLGFILWAVHLYVMMRYVRWLGGRIPDHRMLKRTKTYMWLLPLLSTVGMMIAIGPLIALILYWNILDRLKKHIVAIQTTKLPAPLKGVNQS
jgi:hypothetical protein